ncbi:TPA: helix-turn-helix domain-containing protein [Streptococcus suis]
MNNIKLLREEVGHSQSKLIEEIAKPPYNLKISRRTLQYWESGERDIKLDKAEKLADYFGVQLPYLLGWSDIRTTEKEIGQMINDFDTDFLNFLKYHDLYLSDEQIKIVTNTMYSMSNINNLYLSTFVRNGDISGMSANRKMFFSKLFEYSTHWQLNFDSVKRMSEMSLKFSDTKNDISTPPED